MALSPTVRCKEPMRFEINIEPHGDGWRLRSSGPENEASFDSGWQAELAARAIAKSLARAGCYSAIHIYIRSGELVGTILSGPDEPLVH